MLGKLFNCHRCVFGTSKFLGVQILPSLKGNPSTKLQGYSNVIIAIANIAVVYRDDSMLTDVRASAPDVMWYGVRQEPEDLRPSNTGFESGSFSL